MENRLQAVNHQPAREKFEQAVNKADAIEESIAIATRGDIAEVLSPAQLTICKQRSMAFLLGRYFSGQAWVHPLDLSSKEKAALAELDLAWRAAKTETLSGRWCAAAGDIQ